MIQYAHNHTGARDYGNGQTAKATIEGAARQGYLDALADRSYSTDYDRAGDVFGDRAPQWQRNYEAGRQWAAAVRAVGLTPAEWPEGARVPSELLAQLGEVRRVTGSGTRPEDVQMRPADDPAPLHAVVPTLRRGRILERITQ